MKKYYLITTTDEYKLEINLDSRIYKELLKELPVEGIGMNIGGEIYFNITNDIPFNGLEREVFDQGDIVYWRSQETTKFAIAILYGNTNFGDGTKPRTYSPCIKFAKIKSEFSKLENFETGNPIKIISK